MKVNEYVAFQMYVDTKVILSKLDDKVVNRAISIFEIRDYIQFLLKYAINYNEYNNFIDNDSDDAIDLYCMVSYDESLEKNEIIISGRYGMGDLDLIILGSAEEVYLSKDNWYHIKDQVSKVMFHEFIHHLQSLARLCWPQRDPSKKEIKYSLNPDCSNDSYRINPDELDAYAYQVAADFCSYSVNPFWFLAKLRTSNILHNINNDIDDINDFYLYKQDLIKDSKLWKKFIKKIYKHIVNIDNFGESIIP